MVRTLEGAERRVGGAANRSDDCSNVESTPFTGLSKRFWASAK